MLCITGSQSMKSVKMSVYCTSISQLVMPFQLFTVASCTYRYMHTRKKDVYCFAQNCFSSYRYLYFAWMYMLQPGTGWQDIQAHL